MSLLSTTVDKDLQWKDSITTESSLVRRLLIGAAALHLTLFLLIPLAAIFAEGLKHGLGAYLD